MKLSIKKQIKLLKEKQEVIQTLTKKITDYELAIHYYYLNEYEKSQVHDELSYKHFLLNKYHHLFTPDERSYLLTTIQDIEFQKKKSHK